MYRFCLALAAAALLAPSGSAHYNMLLPETSSAKKGDKVAFVYQFGHPFEHELFDAPQPAKVEVRLPDGKMVDLTKKLEKFKKPGGVDGKDVTAYRFDFTPEQRGDHWFVLTTPPIWMEESKEFYQDVVQVVLHVQTQNGWNELDVGMVGPGELRIFPLTRPYGLLPGMVFQARVKPAYKGQKPIEIERYNSQRPKEIPPDELVTFQTLQHGAVFTCTLTEPGWWSVTAQLETLQKLARDGKDHPIRQRATLWVNVTPKAAGK